MSPSRYDPLFYLIALLALIGSAQPSLGQGPVSVEIQGIEGNPLKNVRNRITLMRRSGEDLRPAEIHRLHRRTPGEIRQALEPLGYYHASVADTLTRNKNKWLAVYNIELGPPVRLTEIQLDVVGPGRHDVLIRRAIQDFPLETGDVLHQGEYEAGKEQFFRFARRHGYQDATFDTSIIEINRQANEASVQLTFRTGPRYRLGTITLHNEALSDTFLGTMIFLRSGDPFNRDELIRQERILESTEYFRQVRVEPDLDTPESGQTPLDIRLSPAPRRTYSVGGGYGTNTGPRFRFNYLDRRVNPQGHQYRVNTLLSPRLVELDSTYMIPLGNPNQTRLELNASVSHEDFPYSVSTLGQVGPVHVSSRGNWTERKSLKLRQENFRMTNQNGHSTLLVPSWSLRKLQLDRSELPRRGYSLSGRLRGSGEVLGSEASFLQFSGEARYVRRLLPIGLRLHLRNSLGATAVNDVTDLPPTLRFFTGGDDSVRGYSYFGLGARRGGTVIGGKHLLVGSAELEQDVVGNWSVAVFFDAGNSFNQFGTVQDRYKRAQGVGIRWRSPIGPFQLDYAQALDEPGDPARIHFSIGPRI